MKKALILLLVLQSIYCGAQNHTLGFYLNGIHNINTYDDSSDYKNESISLPLHLLAEYGLQYTYGFKKKPFGIFLSLGASDNGVRVKRSFGSTGGTRSTSANFPNIRFGISEQIGAYNILIGPSFTIYFNNLSGTSGVSSNSSNSVSQNIPSLRGKLHNSVYLKISRQLLDSTNLSSRLEVNLVLNAGLQQVFQTVNTRTDFTTGEIENIIVNNTGTFVGLGLTYSRFSDDRFKKLFSIRNSSGHINGLTKVVGSLGGIFLLVFLAS